MHKHSKNNSSRSQQLLRASRLGGKRTCSFKTKVYHAVSLPQRYVTGTAVAAHLKMLHCNSRRTNTPKTTATKRRQARRAHLRFETHVDHAVGFVQHDVVALLQNSIPPLQAIQHAAGGRDHDLAPLAELEPLLLNGLAAHN
jgi:hypothetical protein